MVQGNLIHEKYPPPRTLQCDCLGPYAGPRGGSCFSSARYPCCETFIDATMATADPLVWAKKMEEKYFDPYSEEKVVRNAPYQGGGSRAENRLQGYLAHEKHHPPRTLQ